MKALWWFILLAGPLGGLEISVEDLLSQIDAAPWLRASLLAADSMILNGEAQAMGMDLSLGYEVMAPDNPEMRQHRILWRQGFAGWAQNSGRRELGRLRARTAREYAEEIRIALSAEARRRLSDIQALREQSRAYSETQALLETVRSVVQAQFLTGRASLALWNGLQNRIDRTLMRRTQLDSSVHALVQELLGMTELKDPDLVLKDFALVWEGPLPSDHEYEAAYENQAPALRRLFAEQAVMRLEAETAERGFWPELMLMGGYSFSETDLLKGTWNLGFEISLPTLSSPARLAMSAEARLKGEGLEQELLNERRKVFREYRASRLRIEALDANWQRLETQILPRLEQTIEASLEGFRVGRASWAELQEALQERLDLRLDQSMIRKERNEELIRLEAVSGLRFIRFTNEDIHE